MPRPCRGGEGSPQRPPVVDRYPRRLLPLILRQGEQPQRQLQEDHALEGVGHPPLQVPGPEGGLGPPGSIQGAQDPAPLHPRSHPQRALQTPQEPCRRYILGRVG